MKWTRKYLPVHWVAALLLCAFFPSETRSQAAREDSNALVRIADDTDWWSIVRGNSEPFQLEYQNLDTDASNFQIAGITVGDDTLPEIVAKFGKTTTVSRGDADAGRSQICYASAGEPERVHLIFEIGEVQSAFYLFADGPSWNGADLCAASQRITPGMKTASGLRLGLTRSQVERILGEPTAREHDRFVYFRQCQKRTLARDLQRLRENNPHLDENKLHQYYDFYGLTVYIEARFSGAKLTYLGASKSETY